MPRSLGSKGFQDDFQRIYCENLRDMDYVLKNQVPQIKKIIKNLTFDDQNLLVSQMISLLTGVPDFMVRSEKFTDGQDWLRASVDRIWDQWAEKQSQKFGTDLLFEESLTLELVDTSLYFNRFRKNFGVIFDVNLGEFDRINQMVGKISTKFYIKVSKGFLNWMRKQLLSDEDNFLEINAKAKARFKKIVVDFIEEARFKFTIPPWKGDLAELIVRKLSDQLLRIRSNLYKVDDRGMVNIPVVFNYGPFALKYIRYQHKVNKNQENIKKTLEFFQNQRTSKAAIGR
jgi:Fe-S cluster biosynthesis and repair protein YggX